MKNIMRLIKEEDGQAVAEYAILVTVVSLITFCAISRLGAAIAGNINLAVGAFN